MFALGDRTARVPEPAQQLSDLWFDAADATIGL
jgi:hypothetical protein